MRSFIGDCCETAVIEIEFFMFEKYPVLSRLVSTGFLFDNHLKQDIMYAIAIDNTIQAVSETLESAMRAVPQIIIKWDGEIRNENCINWLFDGLIVDLKYWYARGKFSISNEDTIYELTIKPIEKV